MRNTPTGCGNVSPARKPNSENLKNQVFFWCNIPVIFDTFTKTLSGKSLTKNEGKDHIYLDKFGMGSIYVIKYRFYEKSWKIRKLCQPNPT